MQLGEVKEHNTTAALFAAPSTPIRAICSIPSRVAKPFPSIRKRRRCWRAARCGRLQAEERHLLKPVLTDLVAVDSLDIAVRQCETVGLVGESGSGKTTFGQALLRLISHESGEILFHGMDIAALTRTQMKPLRQRMQIVFQDPFGSLNPRMSVGQIIEEGLKVNASARAAATASIGCAWRCAMRACRPTCCRAFRTSSPAASVSASRLPAPLRSNPNSSSSTSRRRPSISRSRRRSRIAAPAAGERGLSYLFISHDLKVVRAMCHRVLVMQHGKIVERGDVAKVLSDPQTDYTRRLVRAALEIAT